MAVDTNEMIGTILGPEAKRDAIHVAVEPVVAGEMLQPGTHVKLVDGKAYRGFPAIGIVDPFVVGVKAGERFFLFLYPRTVTSLRHVWTHPQFEPEAAVAPSREESELWLRQFIDNADCPDYDTVIAAASGEVTESDESYNDG